MIYEPLKFDKPRETGEILSDSFVFLKQEFFPISKLILIYVLPFLIVYGIVQVVFQQKMSEVNFMNQEAVMQDMGQLYLRLFVYLLFAIFIQSLLIGTFYTYIEAYVKLGAGKFTISEISHQFFGNSLQALKGSIAYTFFVVGGLMFCIVPGILFGVYYSLMVFALVFGKNGLGFSMAKSWKLVQSNWWDTFVLNLVGFAFLIFIAVLFALPGQIAGLQTLNLNMKETIPAELPDWFWIVSGISSVVSMICSLYLFTILAMQYFNLTEREKRRIQRAIENLKQVNNQN